MTEPPTPSASASASPSPRVTARAGLAGVADLINSPDGASILVIGDGSGNQSDEWVSVWARDHLAKDATVSYSAWDRDAGEYADAVEHGSSERRVAVWNASVGAPDMASEPERIAKAWQDVDVVLLSYGHRRSADQISSQMDAVLAAVRAESESVRVVVLIQNPERASTESAQRATTAQIKRWADAEGLPTADIYSAFIDDPARRNDLVEQDGSPTPEGSRLWAKTWAEALAGE
ncbi:MAG TPA: SGNH/GDSL hydrolase family protein [Dermatophilaceae bacterium]|nr:SGNH/GDSL hydrolase family protein [Dermatophilaceae bacterium]